MDLGVYVAYTNGISLQQEATWLSFIGRDADEITYGANDAELYFDEHEIESFFVRMRVFDVELIHGLFEHNWGQRVVRFYDMDGHIIEVGEHIGDVARRFLAAGMTHEQAAQRMEIPLEMMETYLKDE
jgi:hypothetical protein